MKQQKSMLRVLTNKIKDNTVLIRYSKKKKAKELILQNEALKKQITELKAVNPIRYNN